jgi:hypothetical protein
VKAALQKRRRRRRRSDKKGEIFVFKNHLFNHP